MAFQLIFVHISFSSVWVAASVWEKLLTRLTICSFCILTIYSLFFSYILVLSAVFGF